MAEAKLLAVEVARGGPEARVAPTVRALLQAALAPVAPPEASLASPAEVVAVAVTAAVAVAPASPVAVADLITSARSPA